MQVVTHNLLNESNVEIVPFSDLHIGSTECDIELITSRIEYVRRNPNAYAIILGDLINNSVKSSVGDVYGATMTPHQQIETAVEMFRPIADKILGVCSGNHEDRTLRNDGIDLCGFFCVALEIEKVYSNVSALLFLYLGKRTDNGKKNLYTLYMTHGNGQGGKTMGGKLNGLERRGRIVNADIIVTGHTHSPATFKEDSYEIDRQNRRVNLRTTTFVNCASTLGFEAYAEKIGLQPSSTAQPVIILEYRNKNVQVRM